MSRARLPIILAILAVVLAGAAAAVVSLRTHSPVSAELPIPLPVQAAVTLPTRAPADLSPPTPAVTPPVPAPPVSETRGTLPALLAELNAELPKLGVPPPARLTAATVENDLLVLTFSADFRPHLGNLSAIDELTAALSSRVSAHGYRNLDLRMLDAHGRARSLAELTITPPARRPRPEPIDDGVRR